MLLVNGIQDRKNFGKVVLTTYYNRSLQQRDLGSSLKRQSSRLRKNSP